MDSNIVPCNNFVIMIEWIIKYCRENNIDHKDVVFFENHAFTNSRFGYKIGNIKWDIFWGHYFNGHLNLNCFNIRKLSFEDVVYILNDKIDKQMIVKYFDKIYINYMLQNSNIDEEIKTYIRMFI